MTVTIKDRPVEAKECYARKDFEVRPVTIEDKWCTHREPDIYAQFNYDAPYGHIIVIPEWFNGMILELNGYIIKNKFDHNGTLYLQVVETYCC